MESGSRAALSKNGQSGSGNGAPKFQSERERERRSVKVGSGKQSDFYVLIMRFFVFRNMDNFSDETHISYIRTLVEKSDGTSPFL